MATEALNLVKQLSKETGDLRKLADTVKKVELTKDFGNILEEVISTLTSVNTELCVGSSASVQDFDELLNGAVANLVTISNQIDPDIAAGVGLLKEGFVTQRAFLAIAAESKQPNENILKELVGPTFEKLEEIRKYKDAKKSSKFYNNIAAIAESAEMMLWIGMPSKPAPYVREMESSAMFYINKILKEFRQSDPRHVDWKSSLIKVIHELEAYVKKHHLTGVTWNRQGKDASAPSATAAPPPPAGGPPPPPPPAVVPPSGPAAPASSDDSSRTALFASLNQGEAITSGLKKVTNDMKTHKNPELRKQPAKQVSTTAKPYQPPAVKSAPKAAAAAPVKKPPRIELTQKKWDVEYYSNNTDIRLDQVEMKQSVYIYKCDNSVINIPNKVNSVTVDSCKKVGVVCESVLGSLDVVNCQSIKMQITGTAHIVNIDKTDGCMVYLSERSKFAEVISAKSSEMNILIPSGEDGDYVEYALPEQYRSVYDANKKCMVTTCTESMG
nr:adenylyl cyclase-associated protein 1-like [Lytechinus pictus]